MDLHAHSIDPRSHHASPSLTYLRLFLSIGTSVSTASVAGLLGLGDVSVQAYPAPANSDSSQIGAIDSIATENEAATPASTTSSESSQNVYSPDLSHDQSLNDSAQFVPELDESKEVSLAQSSLISELREPLHDSTPDPQGQFITDFSDLSSANSIDIEVEDFLDLTTDATTEVLQETKHPSTDWVQWFDYVQAVTEREMEQETTHAAEHPSTDWIHWLELEAAFEAEHPSADWVQWFDYVQAMTEREIADEQTQVSTAATLDDSTHESESYETHAAVLLSEQPIAQGLEPAEESISRATDQPLAEQAATDSTDRLVLNLQGVYLLEGNDSSARGRLSGSYVLTPNVLFGATLDVTTGDAFGESGADGFDVSELFLTVAPSTVPSLRFTVGMIDLTAYFDRNSFAKDAATHFFNPVFQTNPALAAAGLASRPGVMVGWDLTDHLILRGAAFSSDRNLGDFTFDSAAAEVAVRIGNGIIRGTYVNSRDAGRQSGFREIFQFDRGNDAFGILSGDREVAYGVNAEWFIPEVNLGLFARYGWYENQTLGRGGNTYSFGFNLLDLFFADDRLGLAYGRALSNDRLRRDRGDNIPDVFEAFYDLRLTPNLRAGVSLQGREAWSETVLGVRVRADVDLARLWR